ncbi:MAG: site-specific DNA-methyltransferase [Bacteroidaceae bacterium]|nr:site-specific DNA-methyltransferase [Bacteroidaceae bacterium]
MIKQIIDKNTEVKPNSKKLEALKEYFAGCFTKEGTFDIERFKEMMKDEVDISNEGYSLDFLGKDYANLIASIDTTTVIEPDLEHNSKPENKDSENIYISGDNLDALKHLLKSYAGEVKCIYIDPPYNTGEDDFVYNDNFRFTPEELEKKLSIDEDEAQRIIDLTSRGSSTHSAWLMFMSPRLQLARDLLSKDGVIFISIDDNEQANLKLLCDYIFGEENFVAQFIWEKRVNRENRNETSVRHDYILCYSKEPSDEKRLKQMPMNEKALANYGNPDNDPRGPWKSDPAHAQAGHGTKSQFYTLVAPNGKKHELPSGRCWLYTQPVMEGAIKDNRIWFGNDGNGVPRIKTYLYAKDRGLTPETMLFAKDASTNEKAKNYIKDLFDGVAVFETPKPVELINILTKMASGNDIVVDFFSGSASTAESIMRRNLDGLQRKYIMVQWQEKCKEDSEAYKAGYRTIDEIGQERIKRAAAKIKAENPLFAGDLGFKHYTLREVPENVLDKLEEFSPDVSGFANNMLELFGRETVLETWKVRDGYGMNAKVEPVQLADYTAYQCGDHLYLTDEGMGNDAITALVDKYGEQTDWEPHYVVLFGYSFNFGTTSALKTNLPLLSEGEKQIKINIDIRY